MTSPVIIPAMVEAAARALCMIKKPTSSADIEYVDATWADYADDAAVVLESAFAFMPDAVIRAAVLSTSDETAEIVDIIRRMAARRGLTFVVDPTKLAEFEARHGGGGDLDEANLRSNSLLKRAIDAEFELKAATARAEKAEAEVADLRADKARLDFLDRCNASLNNRYGTRYGWQMVIDHNVTRLLLGRDAIDLNDAHGGYAQLPSCRNAIDQKMREMNALILNKAGRERWLTSPCAPTPHARCAGPAAAMRQAELSRASATSRGWISGGPRKTASRCAGRIG